jgi:uncharacterized protein YdhG (YjbR/CyaY superfamily)
MYSGKPAATVDDYLAELPEDSRAALQKLRETIKAAAPLAEERISYGMPGYYYHGRLVFFAAQKNFLSFYGVSRELLDSLGSELEPFEISGTTIHFTAKNPLPAKLVEKIVKARIEQNEARAKNKK